MTTSNKINKSAVMARAWNIYNNNRNMFPTFSSALSKAWEVEKANLASSRRKAAEEKQTAWYNANKEVLTGFIFSNMTSVEQTYINNTYNGD